MAITEVEKNKALEAALKQIERSFGKGSIMKLGEGAEKVEIEVISTGSLGLDIALGVGGLPRGRIIEIYGPESSGKTTLTLHVIAEAQKRGGTCAFVDAEHALDPVYARKLGVNVDDLIISQPDTGEQALEITETLVRSGALDVLVIDSVAALVPRAELEGEMGESHMGLQARLMSQALRKLTSSISRSRCMVIFINQIRQKIGVMFGNPETTTGGNALKFYASVRLDIRRIGAIKDKEEVVGNQTRVKVVKNKVAPPLKVVDFDIMYGEGISKTGELLDLGVKAEVVEKAGSWYSWNGKQLGQGKEAARRYLKDNPDAADIIENAIRGNVNNLEKLTEITSDTESEELKFKMLMLAVDAASDGISIAIFKDNVLLEERAENTSAQFFPFLKDILYNQNIKLSDVSDFAVTKGPGSFTGIRFGLSIAQGLKIAGNMNVYGVNTLDAMAFQAYNLNSSTIICLSTKRGDYYCGLYDVNTYNAKTYSIMNIAEITALGKNYHIVINEQAQEIYNPYKILKLKASSLGQFIIDSSNKEIFHNIDPFYLRPPKVYENIINK